MSGVRTNTTYQLKTRDESIQAIIYEKGKIKTTSKLEISTNKT